MQSTTVRTLLTCSFLFLLPFYSMAHFSGTDYQKKSAETKQKLLWNEIVRTQYKHKLPTEKPGFLASSQLLYSRFLQCIFKTESDEREAHQKPIHTYGSVAKFRFLVTQESIYTGLFRSGGVGLARISLAKSPEPDFVPGMALKFLIDNQPSINFNVMYTLEGQGGNHNPFAHNFSNAIPKPENIDSFLLRWVFGAFNATVELLAREGAAPKSATHLPIFQAAQRDSAGNQISNPMTPDQIIFKPTDNVKNLISETSTSDLRDDLSPIPVNTPFYHVYVKYSLDADETYLGDLITESEFIASEFGDQRLFFKHERRQN